MLVRARMRRDFYAQRRCLRVIALLAASPLYSPCRAMFRCVLAGMPRNRGTCKASKSGTGNKKYQVARRRLSNVKFKSEHAAEGGSSVARTDEHAELALEWWLGPRRDDPWFEKVDACEAEVNAAAQAFNRVSCAVRDLPRDEYRNAVRGAYAKWSKAVAAWEACYPHENMEMPCCEHCKLSVFHCPCVSSLPCKVCAGKRWRLGYADVRLWFPTFCVCERVTELKREKNQTFVRRVCGSGNEQGSGQWLF